ncbi:hypothetical protein LX16_4985 [Stackebrandtia albiflava]|uniref:Uncharacterized protein n=1 Tax=Stackebrandtia albiflava TaxID=406432 RepID=A0A562UPH0_9ACTN|nr:hypothetical protein [Stackebrandtia albiflava]TWJ07502.1 hypothetical protein LX16_4985 [Stackebrandtia albiflava]
MSMESDLIAMQDGADAALLGGEEIAKFAGQMFSDLESMKYDLVGQGGRAFQNVQETMRVNLDIIDRTLNQVGNGIKDSSLNFNNEDDTNSRTIENSLGTDAVALLTNGQ